MCLKYLFTGHLKATLRNDYFALNQRNINIKYQKHLALIVLIV